MLATFARDAAVETLKLDEVSLNRHFERSEAIQWRAVWIASLRSQ
jgi:hypothetical protein